MTRQFGGVGVALVTPFNEDQSIDFEGLGRVINHVIKGGVDYLVVMGTTGESPTLSLKEKLNVLRYVIDHAQGKPIVYGHGGNNTNELIDQLYQLKGFKIDAILSVAPYYNRPSQLGMQRHFEAIADASPFPVLLYNVPYRTCSNIDGETTVALSKHKNIIGIKEAIGDKSQWQKILDGASSDFYLISGDDQTTLPMIAMGGAGTISVIANYLPTPFAEMVHLGIKGNLSEAEIINKSLQKNYELMGKEGNPVSVKVALKNLGLCRDVVRLPLVSGSSELAQEIKSNFLG